MTTTYQDIAEDIPYPHTARFKGGGTSTSTYNGGHVRLLRRGEKRKKPPGGIPGGAFVAPTEYHLESKTYRQPPVEWELPVHPSLMSLSTMPASMRGFGEHTLLADATGWFGDTLREANMRNRLIIELRLQVKDQSVNLAQAYAERQMTADLLADTLNRIAKSLQALRRRRWKEAWRWLKRDWRQAPETWLEYQYGWKPLIQDVMGSVDALQELVDPTRWIQSVKKGAHFESDHFEAFTAYEGGMSFGMDFKGHKETGGFMRFDFEPSAPFFQHLQSNTGIANPLLLAWELLPFSFVFDWGVQVGDWLSSLDATSYMTLKGGSYSLRKELVVIGSPRETHDPLTSPYYRTRPTSTGPTAHYRRMTLDREVFTSWPIAAAPRFKDPFSSLHVANALSLLASALKGGRPPVR
jgi:hypothetical protein